MSTRKVGPVDTKRRWMSASVAPHTLARIDTLASKAGISRGRVLDLALDAMEECEVCDGHGRAEDRRCPECLGFGVHPARQT